MRRNKNKSQFAKRCVRCEMCIHIHAHKAFPTRSLYQQYKHVTVKAAALIHAHMVVGERSTSCTHTDTHTQCTRDEWESFNVVFTCFLICFSLLSLYLPLLPGELYVVGPFMSACGVTRLTVCVCSAVWHST